MWNGFGPIDQSEVAKIQLFRQTMANNHSELEKRLWEAADDFEFAVRLEELNEELETLNGEARELEERIAENVSFLLGASA